LIVYVDSSVLLARLFAEDRAPADAFFMQRLVASRLLEYEVFNRVHARAAMASHGETARQLVDRVNLVEMSPTVLDRALRAFPEPVRTLDALHLATLEFLRGQGLEPRLATYDRRLAAAAHSLGFSLAEC
jgi:predicted nucleic acid-binding protein